MTDPLPTFTVGVGQAGIAMLNTLAETVERNESEELFDYFAIDTDGDTLGSVPPGTTRVRLQPSDAHENEDKATYPYLTEDSEIGGKGAERQRPVGRYKLDSRGTETFDDYFEELWYDILEHYQEVDYAFTEDRDSYNIFLLHSVGGGTGSGTFPLLSAMVNRIAQRIEDQNPTVDVYIAGVGVAPQVDFDPEVTDPPGEAMYYPNTYSSLSDLSNMLDADTEPRDIPLYSKSFGQGGTLSDVDERVEDSFTGNSIPIERAPYNDYWLIGVDENLITSGTGTDFVEGYREQINRRVAESIYALSEMEQSVENWSSRAKGTAPLGTVGHAQLTVPHKQVREFCKMKDERKAKQTLVTETIPDLLEDLRSEKDNLEEIKQDPTTVNEHLEDVSDWQQNFRGRFEAQLGAGNALVRNSTDEDIERVLKAIEEEASRDEPEAEDGETSDKLENLDEIRADQRPELLLLATEILEEMLQSPNAAPAVEEHWEELVSGQWRTYDMADRTKFGGSATSTLEGKAEALKTFYDEKITEFEEKLENIDLGTLGQVQEVFPPWNPLTESDREAAEKKLNRLRESRDDLLEADGRYQRVQGMKEAVRTRRNRAKNLLDDKISAVNSLITERESAKEDAENRIDALERSIEQEKDELASEGTGKRLGIFPLRRDKLDDEELTLQRVDEELTSLDAYVNQDFIDPRKVRNGINQWLSNATSWEEPVFDLNYSGTDRDEKKSSRQEMWLLYHEDNEEYAREDVDTFFGGTTRRSGSDGMIDYINDPYSISFVSFYNRGPVEALTLYQRLRDMADREQLDSMAGKYRDYRQAFAYPEWYDRDIRMAFQIKSRIDIPRPPELDIDRVEKPDLSEGELKNSIKQTGLDTYMWRGTMWEDYEFGNDDDVFDGWDRTLEGITFTSLQQATPDPELKSRWLAGQADWDDILEAYKKNLEDSEELQVTFE